LHVELALTGPLPVDATEATPSPVLPSVLP
jgi:hypothetical protein